MGGIKGCGYNNISIPIIEKVNIGDHAQLAKSGVYWQHQFRFSSKMVAEDIIRGKRSKGIIFNFGTETINHGQLVMIS